jgi:protease-4
MAGSETISKRLRKSARDDSVKAVVLRINSPGGDAFASEVIRQEVISLAATGKPVIVSMGDVAASGGYWIAMGADEVISNSATITGSIGIFGLFPTFQDSLASLGIYTDGVGTAPQAGSLRADRALSEPVKAEIEALVEQGYRDFLQLVSEHRNMSIEEVDAVAQGRVWSGSQALQRNLVDAHGGLQAAVDAASRRAELSDYEVFWQQDELSAWQRWLLGSSVQMLTSAGLDSDLLRAGKLPMLPPALEQQVRQQLLPFLRQQRNPQLLAHCLCLSLQ